MFISDSAETNLLICMSYCWQLQVSPPTYNIWIARPQDMLISAFSKYGQIAFKRTYINWHFYEESVNVVPYLYICLRAKSLQSCLTLCDPMDCSPPGSSVHGDSPGKNTRVCCHALLQGIFPTQESNAGLSYCRWILYHLSHQGSPTGLELVTCRDSQEPRGVLGGRCFWLQPFISLLLIFGSLLIHVYLNFLI